MPPLSPIHQRVSASLSTFSPSHSHQATSIATQTQDLPGLPWAFFCRPAEEVAPELIGCLLVKRQAGGELLCGVIVDTEAYCQSEPACHGYRRLIVALIKSLMTGTR